MKRFEFKLQSLLNFREYLERLAQQMTAKAHMDIKACEKQIGELKDTYSTASRKLEEDMIKGLDAARFRQHHTFLDRVEKDIKDQLLNKDQLLKILEEKLKNLKKRSIDKKIIEQLKEKKATEYSEEFLKSEQKLQDEISSVTKARELQNHER